MWILNNIFSSFPIHLFAIFNQRDWKENLKLNIYCSKCTSLIKHRGNLNAQIFKLIFCKFLEFMVLKLLKLKISWRLQEHPFFIWLILLMHSISHLCHHAHSHVMPCSLDPGMPCSPCWDSDFLCLKVEVTSYPACPSNLPKMAAPSPALLCPPSP